MWAAAGIVRLGPPQARARALGAIPVGQGDPAAGLNANPNGSYSFGGQTIDSPLPSSAAPLVAAAARGGFSPGDMENYMGLAMGALSTVTGGVSGAFWLAWLGIQTLLQKIYGTAGSGPGCCVAGGCTGSEFTWETNVGTYTPPAAGTFEEFAYAAILADWSNLAHCPPDVNDPNATWWSPGVSMARMPSVLQLAIASWNASHSSAGSATLDFYGFPVPGSGGTRTISSTVLGPGTAGGFAGGAPAANDPIDVALNAAAAAANQAAGIAAGDPTDYGVVSTTRVVAPGAVVSFTVNNGPAVAQTIAPGWAAVAQSSVPPGVQSAMAFWQLDPATSGSWSAPATLPPAARAAPVFGAVGPVSGTVAAPAAAYATDALGNWYVFSGSSTATTAPATSTAATVALVGGGLIAAAAGAAAITAYSTRRTFGQVLRGWWTALGGGS